MSSQSLAANPGQINGTATPNPIAAAHTPTVLRYNTVLSVEDSFADVGVPHPVYPGYLRMPMHWGAGDTKAWKTVRKVALHGCGNALTRRDLVEFSISIGGCRYKREGVVIYVHTGCRVPKLITDGDGVQMLGYQPGKLNKLKSNGDSDDTPAPSTTDIVIGGLGRVDDARVNSPWGLKGATVSCSFLGKMHPCHVVDSSECGTCVGPPFVFASAQRAAAVGREIPILAAPR
ncbi:MAG: hypothetical protein ACSHW2_08020 [Parasphingopyxis sp.]